MFFVMLSYPCIYPLSFLASKSKFGSKPFLHLESKYYFESHFQQHKDDILLFITYAHDLDLFEHFEHLQCNFKA